MLYTTLEAIEYSKKGLIEEWIHDFLNSVGNNIPLSEGLKRQKRYYVGPIKIDLKHLVRCCGPENGIQYQIDKDNWEIRIALMQDLIKNNWQMPPLIVEHIDDQLIIRDGNHRYEAMIRSNFKYAYVIIWDSFSYENIHQKLSSFKINKVESFYDEHNEWNRLERHKIEFDITKRYLNNYMIKPNSKVFDCGGGPGRYAIYLSQIGHDVTLLDLSFTNIEIAKKKNLEYNGSITRFIYGNALNLDEYHLEKYDYILLMGPLYHLINLDDRKKVLNDVKKYLKDDGIIFVSFISNYAPIVDSLKFFGPLNGRGHILLNYLDNGINTGSSGFTEAYFSSSDEIKDLMDECGYRMNSFIGIENVLALVEQKINSVTEEEYQQWLEICYQLSQDEKLFGVSEHYLYIGTKK